MEKTMGLWCVAVVLKQVVVVIAIGDYRTDKMNPDEVDRTDPCYDRRSTFWQKLLLTDRAPQLIS